MRLSTWMNPLPGDSPDAADRLVALKCAMRLTPDSVVASGASQAGQVTSLARKFEDWLSDAGDEQDKHVRRAVLVMVCDKADETTSAGRIRALVKELHHYVTRH